MQRLLDGTIVYDCLICHDSGWVHPRDEETGQAIYSKVVKCYCRREKKDAEIHSSDS